MNHTMYAAFQDELIKVATQVVRFGKRKPKPTKKSGFEAWREKRESMGTISGGETRVMGKQQPRNVKPVTVSGPSGRTEVVRGRGTISGPSGGTRVSSSEAGTTFTPEKREKIKSRFSTIIGGRPTKDLPL